MSRCPSCEEYDHNMCFRIIDWAEPCDCNHADDVQRYRREEAREEAWRDGFLSEVEDDDA